MEKEAVPTVAGKVDAEKGKKKEKEGKKEGKGAKEGKGEEKDETTQKKGEKGEKGPSKKEASDGGKGKKGGEKGEEKGGKGGESKGNAKKPAKKWTFGHLNGVCYISISHFVFFYVRAFIKHIYSIFILLYIVNIDNKWFSVNYTFSFIIHTISTKIQHWCT